MLRTWWPERAGNRPGRPVFCLLAGCVLLSAAGFWFVAGAGSDPLPVEVTPEELERALREFRFLQRREPVRSELLLLLAETAVRQNRLPTALACLSEIPTGDQQAGVTARRLEAQVCLKASRAVRLESAAGELLRAAEAGTAVRPAELQLIEELLVFLFSLEYRFEERQQLLKQMAARRSLDVLLAKQLHFPALLASRTVQQNQRLQRFLEEDPDHPPLVLAHARYLLSTARLDDAEKLADSMLAAHPGSAEALAVALECRFERQALAEFTVLLSAAPAFQPTEPWLLTQMRAEGAVQSGDRGLAKLYFEHLTAMDPSNPLYLQGLAGVTATDTAEGTAERSRLRKRALLLAELRLTLAESDSDAGALRAVAEAARKLDMPAAAEDFERLAKIAASGGSLQRRSEQ